MTAAPPVIGAGRLGLLQRRGRKARVRLTEIEAGGGRETELTTRTHGGGSSSDRKTAWASTERALDGGVLR
jgi:hypothetical protein